MSLLPLRCRGCGRKFGVADSPHYKVFCEERCAEDFPVFSQELRDAHVVALSRLKWKAARIAKEFSITRQRVQQIVEGRKV